MWEMLALVTGYSFLRNLVNEQRKTNELLKNDRKKIAHLNQRIAQLEEKNHELRLPYFTPDRPLKHLWEQERKIRNMKPIDDIEKSIDIFDVILKPFEFVIYIMFCLIVFFLILLGAALLSLIGGFLFLFLPAWATGIILLPIILIYVFFTCVKCSEEEASIESMLDAIQSSLNMMEGMAEIMKCIGCILLGLLLLTFVGALIFFLIQSLFV